MPIYVGTAGNDSIVASAGDDTLQGGAGSDTLFGQGGNDSLEGGSGSDLLIGGTGADTLYGGSGNDVYYVDTFGDVLIEEIGSGFDWVIASGSYALTLGAEIEQLGYGTTPVTGVAPSTLFDQAALVDVNFTGNEFYNELYGTGGANVLAGGRNANPLTGDYLRGNGGDDILVIMNPNDFADGGAGVDTVYVSVADLEAQGQAVATYNMLVNGGNAEVISAQDQSGTQNLSLTGNGAVQTIVGNMGNNTLNGGGGGDTLIGLGGDDVYVIGNANDVILSETGGFDTVSFNGGVTSFNFTTASGGAMKGASIERIELDGVATHVVGNDAAQTIVGTAASETIEGGAGMDTLIGGAGNDVLLVDMDGEVVTEAAGGGNDAVIYVGGTGGYNLANGAAVEALAAGVSSAAAPYFTIGYNLDLNGAAAGTPGVYLVGNTLSQGIAGAGGNDILDGDRGATTNADTLYGGAGNDTYRVYDQNDVANETQFDGTGLIAADSGGNDIVFTSGNYSLAANAATVGGDWIERLAVADASSTTGYALTGSGINNTIQGSAGNDTIDGLAGADQMVGLGGNDRYFIDDLGDTIIEAAGGGTDRATVNVDNYVLNDGAEVERLDMTITGTISGNDMAQLINGTAGNDTITGGGGADTLAGGAGDDTYNVGNPEVVISDNSGANIVNYTASTGGINIANGVTVTQINATSPTGDVYLVGNNQVQTITGNAGNNILNGGGGVDGSGRGDTLIGGAGDDTYRVFSSNFDGTAGPANNQGDRINESAGGGTDTVYTSVSYVLRPNIENLIAADGTGVTNLTLIGNDLANSISGSAGNNVIYGGLGRDYLTGLAGSDTFHFAEMTAANYDTIADFVSGTDKISLDAGAFTNFGATINGNEFQLGTVANADTAGSAAILYDQATGRLFYDADGSGAGGAEIFAQLNPGTALSINDFVLTPAGTIPTPM